MSSSIALRRSPKPGALTAATLRPPRRRLTTSVASASPSTSSAMISSGRPDCTTASEHRQHGLQAGQLLLVQQHVDVLELGGHLLGVGDEVGRQIAAVELHALDDVDLGLQRLVFLDGDDALVADLLHRLRRSSCRSRRRHWPRSCRPGRLSAEDATGLARFSMSLTTAVTAMSMPRFRSIGFMPAATDLAPSRTMAWASTVAVVVPSPAMSLVLEATSRTHLRAHVLELVLELDLLGDGDAVLGDARRAERLVEDDVAALRTERDLDRIGENVDAAQHALAGVAVKFYVLGSHCLTPLNGPHPEERPIAASRRMSCDAGPFETAASPPPRVSRPSTHAHDVGLLHDQEFLAVELDLGARPLAEQHAVADLDVDAGSACRPRRGAPGPTATTSPSEGFSLAVSGMMMPPLVFSSASMRLTTTRSCSGRNLDLAMTFPQAFGFQVRFIETGVVMRPGVTPRGGGAGRHP